MKQVTTLLITFLFTLCLQAEYDLPRNSFSGGELDKAKQMAASKKKPLAFLTSENDTSCPLCQNATDLMIKELKSMAIIVYIDTKSWNDAPRNVRSSWSSKGKFIPKVAIFDPSVEKELGLVTYEMVKEDGKKAFKEVKKAVRGWKKTG